MTQNAVQSLGMSEIIPLCKHKGIIFPQPKRDENMPDDNIFVYGHRADSPAGDYIMLIPLIYYTSS